MHKALPRVAAFAAMLTMLVPSAARATGVTSNDCGAGSTKLYTGLPNSDGTRDRVWVDNSNSSRTLICIQFWSQGFGGMTIVADTSSGTAPAAEVNPYGSTAACPHFVNGAQDPVHWELRNNESDGTICLTVDTTTITIRFTPGTIGVPTIEVWHDGSSTNPGRFGWFDVAACPAQYAVLLARLGTDRTCLVTNSRIV